MNILEKAEGLVRERDLLMALTMYNGDYDPDLSYNTMCAIYEEYTRALFVLIGVCHETNEYLGYDPPSYRSYYRTPSGVQWSVAAPNYTPSGPDFWYYRTPGASGFQLETEESIPELRDLEEYLNETAVTQEQIGIKSLEDLLG